MGTPCSLLTSSICGGRPGEKIRSLTLSETSNICCSTLARFSEPGAAGASWAGVSEIALIYVYQLACFASSLLGFQLQSLNDEEGNIIGRAQPLGPTEHVAMNEIDHLARAQMPALAHRFNQTVASILIKIPVHCFSHTVSVKHE